MPNLTGLDNIVVELRSERTNLTNQLRHVDAALSVLGKLHGKMELSNGDGRPTTVMSAAARRRISIAQKARWAKMRGSSPNSNRMSAAARRKISLAQKARWAKVKSTNGTQLTTGASNGNGQSRNGSRMSAVARKRMSLAQKARWAKIRSGKKK